LLRWMFAATSLPVMNGAAAGCRGGCRLRMRHVGLCGPVASALPERIPIVNLPRAAYGVAGVAAARAQIDQPRGDLVRT
jgi:hypothetical protein